MKNLITLTFFLASSAFAQTQNSETASAHELNSLAILVHSWAENVANRLSSTSSTAEFKAPDYWAQLPAFNENAKKALDYYVEKIGDETSGLLSTLRPDITEYKKAHSSQTLSADAAALMKRNILARIQSKIITINQDYQKIIATTFRLALGDLPLTNELLGNCLKGDDWYKFCRTRIVQKVTSFSEVLYESPIIHGWRINFADAGPFLTTKKESECLGCWPKKAISLNNIGPSEERLGLLSQTEVYQKFIYPSIAKHCKYEVCLSMKASDISNLLISLNTEITKDIPLIFADQQLRILGHKMNHEWLVKMILSSVFPQDPKIIGVDAP